MSQQSDQPFLLVSITPDWQAELIEGPNWLFQAGEFASLDRHLHTPRSGHASIHREGQSLILGYVHTDLPFPVKGLLWSPADRHEIPELLYGIFLPQAGDSISLAPLAAAFAATQPAHPDSPVHYTLLNSRGEILASNASALLQRAAANDQPAQGRDDEDTRVTCFRVVNGQFVETDHRHQADWEIRHLPDETPVCDLCPLSLSQPALAMVLRIQLVKVRGLLSQTTELLHLLDLYKTMLWRVGHNIRTPLNAIHGFWQLQALEHPEHSEKGQKRNAIVQKSIRQINQTIEDAVSVPSLAHRPDTQDEWPDFEDSLHEALGLSHQTIESKGMRFHSSGPRNQVRASSAVLVEVLLNLISDAVKFSPHGSAVSVAWHAEPAGDLLSVVFKNQVEALDDLRIVQASPTQRQPQKRKGVPGSGVGLATCAYLLRRLGGNLAPTLIAHGEATSRLTLPLAWHGRE